MSFEFSVDVMLAISSGSLSTPYHMSGGKSLFSFSQLVQKYQTKVWASSLGQYRLMIHQWASLSSAAQDCFSLAHCKLIFFCVHVSAGFRFSFIQPLSYSSISNTDSCFCPFFFFPFVLLCWFSFQCVLLRVFSPDTLSSVYSYVFLHF